VKSQLGQGCTGLLAEQEEKEIHVSRHSLWDPQKHGIYQGMGMETAARRCEEKSK
jgi:hypothetical protein